MEKKLTHKVNVDVVNQAENRHEKVKVDIVNLGGKE